MSNPSVRYQVFVSSTFTDLQEERAEVLQALWELDCLPTGMEAFVATNESQWEVIRKVIDECDYYVLIIGGRYGTVTAEGISYTEKEYEYAKSLGIPVLGFIHGNPQNLLASKVEKEEDGRKKLDSFRTKVKNEYPIKEWSSGAELGGHVSRALVRAFRTDPRPGWTRSSGQSDLDLLKQLNSLRLENEELKKKIESQVTTGMVIPDLQCGSDQYRVYGLYLLEGDETTDTWVAPASWDDIFSEIGPRLQNEASETEIKTSLERFLGWAKEEKIKSGRVVWRNLEPDCFAEVIMQFRALGYIERGKRKRPVSDKESYWGLTQAGDSYLVLLMAKKKVSPPPKELLWDDI